MEGFSERGLSNRPEGRRGLAVAAGAEVSEIGVGEVSKRVIGTASGRTTARGDTIGNGNGNHHSGSSGGVCIVIVILVTSTAAAAAATALITAHRKASISFIGEISGNT